MTIAAITSWFAAMRMDSGAEAQRQSSLVRLLISRAILIHAKAIRRLMLYTGDGR
jgi:hypothetical protein